MRSPVVYALAGTFAIHIVIALAGDALVKAFPAPKDNPTPSIELVDLDPPPPPPEPPPPPPAAEELKALTPAPPPTPSPVKVAVRVSTPTPARTVEPPPVTPTTPNPDSGGSPVVHIDNLAPDARGSVPVRPGAAPGGKVGRGGGGGGTGSGTGQGSSDAPPPPVSVAMIKSRALPKGDFSYVDASRDYPAEAKQLGIEGVIRVRLVVDDKGLVKSAILVNKLGHGLDELALERARKIQFQPARDTDDKPVASVVIWTFNMTLPK